ncbi:hypothetical protein D7W82_10325 [Corallococcus sp. CA049B]|nr:hypothetical protein D7W82_10325 [Corallococcus sp. CA049B]
MPAQESVSRSRAGRTSFSPQAGVRDTRAAARSVERTKRGAMRWTLPALLPGEVESRRPEAGGAAGIAL